MASDISVRVASPDDSENVSALLHASYDKLLRAAYDDALLAAVLPAMTRAQPGLLASGTYYVAETAKGMMVGCGGWTRERPDDGAISSALGHVRHFAVHPEWTRRGVGTAIFERCCRDALAVGVRKFECYSSLNGESFYAAIGFERLRVIQVPMHDNIGFPSVHMVTTI